jgi:hypothetical protein
MHLRSNCLDNVIIPSACWNPISIWLLNFWRSSKSTTLLSLAHKQNSGKLQDQDLIFATSIPVMETGATQEISMQGSNQEQDIELQFVPRKQNTKRNRIPRMGASTLVKPYTENTKEIIKELNTPTEKGEDCRTC